MKRIPATFGIIIGLLGFTGCTHLPESSAPPEIYVELAELELAAEGSAGTNMLQLVNAALQHNPRVQSRLTDVRQAAARTAFAGRIRAPEIRFGVEQSQADGSSSSWNHSEETGASFRSSSSQDKDVYPSFEEPRSTQSGAQNQTSVSQSDRERSGWENIDQTGWSIGLRLYPPNPWQFRAESSEMQARLHLAEAKLHVEQIDAVTEAALLLLRLETLQYEQHVYEKLTEICQQEMKRAQKMKASDYAGALRRSLDIQSDRARSERDLRDARTDIEQATGLRVPQTGFIFDWSWLSANWNDRPSIAQWLEHAVTGRPDVAVVYWSAGEIQARYRVSQSRLLPWIRHIDVSYAQGERDETSGLTGTTTATGLDNRSESSVSDFFSGSQRVETGSSLERSWSREAETGGSSNSRDDHEWSIEAAVTIPIFDWFDHSSDARDSVLAAWREVEKSRIAAENDLHIRFREWNEAIDAEIQFEQNTRPQVDHLRRLIEKLNNGGQLTPDAYIQLSRQIADITLETRAFRHAAREAQIRFWRACGAPF